MKKAELQLESLACPSCMQKIERAIQAVPGVDKDSVKVLFNASKAKVSFDEEVSSLDHVVKAVAGMGYQVLSAKAR